ncbi:translation initiation factor IF-2 [Candidatus Portiera aleyrodidarum]|uniref:translation initiation factor IF-2 n=1 Tax=Candidatus Portiera aleyrodidarum TaxID=91844 RepID=UPI000C7886B6|nr:translation initiation factor IF-2 [Candidatus Portiera aleyrodidarum]AUI73309.1 translation initiation factor IF-2 [Candidatus Portiera aleyrodidarum]
MVEITVKDFAKKLGCNTKRLISYLTNAGVKNKKAENLLTEKDKQSLLTYLFYKQGITNFYLTIKKYSKLHMNNKVIDIQICKNKTFLNLDTEEIERNKNYNRIYNIQSNKKLIDIHTFKNHKTNIIREINIYESNSLLDLAKKLAIKAADLMKALLRICVLVNINQPISKDSAFFVVEEIGHIPKSINVTDNDFEDLLLNTKTRIHNTKNINTQKFDKQKNNNHNTNKNKQHTKPSKKKYINNNSNTNKQYTKIKPKTIKAKTINAFSAGKYFKRCPIITVMGHVDNGKTSLIDLIRNSKLVNNEIGGITQYIDVYHVNLDQGNNITIIDTPGHKAFINMRKTGVKFTDIVILVVSADDGIKPQTIEAIDHAKTLKLPVVVAINKIDKIGTDIGRVRNQLSKFGLIPEEWGGETYYIPVSAKVGLGLDLLLESVRFISELIDLTTVLDSPGIGVVIESRIDVGKGPVAKILVLNGTLKKGDIVLCGLHYGRVRAIINHLGNIVEQIGPSIPAAIIGFNGVPEAGEQFNVVSDEKKAREIVNNRSIKYINNKQKTNLIQDILKKINTINIVLKADVQGTLHALRTSIKELSNDQIVLNIISASVGNLNSNDVNLAIISKAILIGFNVQVVSKARDLIEREHIKFFYFKLIYKFIDGLNEIIHKTLNPKKIEDIIGIAEIRDTFKYNKKNGVIIGCIVLKGKVVRNKKIRIIRNNDIIYKGDLVSLRRFKKDVNEVSTGLEFGVCLRDLNDVKVGDRIEIFDLITCNNKL